MNGHPRRRSPGSVFPTSACITVTLGFRFYVTNVSRYNETCWPENIDPKPVEPLQGSFRFRGPFPRVARQSRWPWALLSNPGGVND